MIPALACTLCTPRRPGVVSSACCFWLTLTLMLMLPAPATAPTASPRQFSFGAALAHHSALSSPVFPPPDLTSPDAPLAACCGGRLACACGGLVTCGPVSRLPVVRGAVQGDSRGSETAPGNRESNRGPRTTAPGARWLLATGGETATAAGFGLAF
jgi:hypothetical protein